MLSEENRNPWDLTEEDIHTLKEMHAVGLMRLSLLDVLVVRKGVYNWLEQKPAWVWESVDAMLHRNHRQEQWKFAWDVWAFMDARHWDVIDKNWEITPQDDYEWFKAVWDACRYLQNHLPKRV